MRIIQILSLFFFLQSSQLKASPQANNIQVYNGYLERSVNSSDDKKYIFTLRNTKKFYLLQVPSHLRGVALLLNKKHVEVRGRTLLGSKNEKYTGGRVQVKNIVQKDKK